MSSDRISDNRLESRFFKSGRCQGGSNNDRLLAGKNDGLFGGNGNHTLDGTVGDGGNHLFGGEGDDKLSGGE